MMVETISQHCTIDAVKGRLMKKQSRLTNVCTPSLDDRKLGVWATLAGHWDLSVKDGAIDREYPEFVLIYCVDGKGYCTVGGIEKLVSPGMFCLLWPSIPHSYRPDPDTGWEIWWVAFDGDYAKQLVETAGLSALDVLRDIGVQDELLGSFRRLVGAIQGVRTHYSAAISISMIDVLEKVIRFSNTPRSADRRFLDRIDYRIQDLAECAARFGYCKSHFIRTFHEITGVTPWHYILHLKVSKAKELLSNTDQTIWQVAAEVGFEDTNYFSRIFRQVTGVSPSSFRSLIGRSHADPASGRFTEEADE